MKGNKTFCTVTVVVCGEGADELAAGFIETVKENNRRSLSCGGCGCKYSVASYSDKGAKMEIGGTEHNGLAASGENGTVELY